MGHHPPSPRGTEVRIVHPLRAVLRAVVRAPGLLRVSPALASFLTRYLLEFPVAEVGGMTFVHSHLPPIDSDAYARFVKLHLRDRIGGPSHAQVAVTARCPQRCPVCYNRDRTGVELDTAEIARVIEDLVSSGAVWIGLTGGEPLLVPELPELVAIGRGRAAMKLFTTGMGATRDLASKLAGAGLSSVSVSLDHWEEAEHDRGRGFPGAWRAAIEGVRTFLATGRLHVGISAVLPRDSMQRPPDIDQLLAFCESLHVHELWLSETKPAVASLWHPALVATEEDRKAVVAYQDRWNERVRRSKRGVTLNYLGHFEGGERFGCNAGRKMVYVDAFGEVSPCVFAPLSFGNVRDGDGGLAKILARMERRFPTEDRCFINRNWPLLERISNGVLPLTVRQSETLVDSVTFRPLSAFNRRYYPARDRRRPEQPEGRTE